MKHFIKPLFLASLLLQVSNSFAQTTRPTLEWTRNGNVSALSQVGPTTSSISVNFYNDLLNPNVPIDQATFTPDGTPLISTISFRNQQYSTLLTGTSTTLQGLTFGGRNTSSDANDPDNPSSLGVQKVGSAPLYAVFAAEIPGSGNKPLNNMYITSPQEAAASATSTTSGGSGTFGGFDTQNITGAKGPGGFFDNTTGLYVGPADANYGIPLYTSVEPLADISASPTGRFYYGDIVISFNRTVKDPVIHLGGLGGSYSYTNSTASTFNTRFTSELELVNGGNNVLSFLAGNTNIAVVNNKITNTNASPNAGSVLGSADYGAASGSVKVSGTYTTLVFRVYMKGTAGNFGWSATQAMIGSSASRDPMNGDLWYISISTDKPTQQISGNVFYDTDAITGDIWRDAVGATYSTTDGSQNGNTLTSVTPGLFHANLLDPNGNVIATMPIGRDGSYLFDNVAPGSYTVSLSSVPGTIGAPYPTGAFPPGWINTGQQTGLIAGTDGTNDGRSALISIAAGGIQTQVNFGVFNPLALPVTLMSFNGALNGTTAKLNWVVTNEISFANYELERSLNGVSYTSIATVAPRGSVGQESYSHNDNVAGLTNKIYYRLKMIDRDGTVRYSNIVMIRLNGVKISNIYPNPFVDAIRVELESKTKENAQIRVTDLSGKVVLSTQEQIQIGGNQFTINGLGKLANGTYMIEVTTSNEKLYEKLVKN